ncbi:hypothetical protein EDD86DRAFT_244924 [Gorgonomyces haynaldii]|nr:hypothetical protein EDD86DRAFT_244924 [Gorgonomyces haynaldii]
MAQQLRGPPLILQLMAYDGEQPIHTVDRDELPVLFETTTGIFEVMSPKKFPAPTDLQRCFARQGIPFHVARREEINVDPL